MANYAKAIPQDMELKAHLDKQMDEHYGELEAERLSIAMGYHGPLNLHPHEASEYVLCDDPPGPMASETMLDNILSTDAAIDLVNLPPHYAHFKIEPIRFVEENGLDFLQGNIIKYLTRWKYKNGLEDLAKAKRCLEMYIKFHQGNPDWWKRSDAKA